MNLFNFKTLTRLGALLGSWLIIVLATNHIQSYITTFDSATYISLARDLLDGDWAQRRIAFYTISPLFPSLLAVSIKLFGMFAPTWVNFCFLIGLIFVLAVILRRWLANSFVEAWCLLSTVLLLMFGCSANSQYLIYPFRETTSFFFLVLGLLGFQNSCRRDWHNGWLLFSSISFLLATMMREPSVLVLVGVGLYILLTCRQSFSRLFWHMFLLLIPFVIVFVLWLSIAWHTGALITGQMNGWVHEIFVGKSWESIGARCWSVLLKTFVCTYHTIGEGIGLAALIFGAWHLRKKLELWCLFVIPAFLLLLFYGIYEANHRYLLGSLLFVGPVVGYGFYSIWENTGRLVAKYSNDRWRKIIVPGGHIVLLIALCSWGVYKTEELPHSRYYSRADVHSFITKLPRLINTNDIILLEIQCYDIGAALSDYTRFHVGSWSRLDDYLKENKRALYFEPLNEKCITPKKIKYTKRLRDGEIQADHMLTPVLGPDGKIEKFHLGRGEYAIWKVEGRKGATAE